MSYICKTHIIIKRRCKQAYVSKHNLKRENQVAFLKASNLKTLYYPSKVEKFKRSCKEINE